MLGKIIEGARSWHTRSLIVSATALLVLFAPGKTDYRNALREAHALRDLRIESYEQFVRGFLGLNTFLPPSVGQYGDWELGITEFLATKKVDVLPGEFPNPTWDIKLIVQFDPAPTNGTLIDWQNWITSTKEASYYEPEWKTARLSMSRDAGPRRPRVRHFVVRASTWRRSPGEYSFRAFLDSEETAADRSQYKNSNERRNWWAALESLDSRDFMDRQNVQLSESRFVVEGDLQGVLKTASAKCGIMHWLQQSGMWQQLTSSGSVGVVVLPEIREHWSELRDKSLSDAIAFMESKKKEIQDVSLLGLSIPGGLCVVAIPFAHCLIFLFLLLDLRAIARLVSAGENIADPKLTPWIAFYDDSLAQLTMVGSLIFLPSLTSIALIVRYFSRIDVNSQMASILLTLAAIFAATAALKLVLALRQRRTTNTTGTASATGSETSNGSGDEAAVRTSESGS